MASTSQLMTNHSQKHAASITAHGPSVKPELLVCIYNYPFALIHTTISTHNQQWKWTIAIQQSHTVSCWNPTVLFSVGYACSQQFNGNFPNEPGLANCPWLSSSTCSELVHPRDRPKLFTSCCHHSIKSSLDVPSNSIFVQCLTVYKTQKYRVVHWSDVAFYYRAMLCWRGMLCWSGICCVHVSQVGVLSKGLNVGH